jgi:Protein kinase domain/PEGA domain
MLQKLGRYEIIEELGRGAMGIIYKAKDPVIGRYVAVKTIRLGDFTDSAHVAELHSRLMREAQSAGVLSHPNIITVFDVGEEAGLAYIAMELVEGATLEHLIESGQALDEAAIVSIARQTADALGFAHQKGIVHRDIKPANIMLTQDGRVKVADFGIAKMGSTKMTQTGMLLGSPSYMAPEHFLGQPLDGRSDIFALGIVLYELITGQPPFAAENLGTLSYKIVHEDPAPPSKLKLGMNPNLNLLIVKALARDPSLRFQTAEEMCAALDALNVPRAGAKTERIEPLLVQTVAVPLPIKKPRRVGVWLLVVFLLLTGATAGVAILYPNQFKHAYYRAMEEVQPWIDRARQAASGQQPETPAPAAETPAPAAESTALPPGLPAAGISETEEAKPAVTPDESAQAPLAVTAEPAPPLASEGSVVEPPPNSTVSPAPLLPKVIASPSNPPAGSGVIQVASSPSGAEIVFDGQQNSAWTTPFTFQNVSKGRHTLEVRKAGHVPERRVVVLQGDESQRVSVALAMASGLLRVSTAPGGASIYVDGELRREVTPASLKIPVGARRILLRKEGYQDVEQVVKIEDSSISTLNPQLAPVP